MKFKTITPAMAEVIEKGIKLAEIDKQWFLDKAKIDQISELTYDRYLAYLRWLLRVQRGEISITSKGGANHGKKEQITDHQKEPS